MKEQSWIEEGWFFHNHAWHLLHEIIKQIPREPMISDLLDVGAGTGIAAAIIQAIFPSMNCWVCDIEKNSEDFWKMRGLPGKVLNMNSDKLPFKDKSFHTVISSHVLEHLEYPKEMIKEMYRVSKKRIIIAIPDGDVHFYDHKIIYNRTIFNNTIDEALQEHTYNKISYPLYHPHINNLIAVIDKYE